MDKITPCLWFDDQAEDAAKLYTSIFARSKINEISRYGKEGFEIHGRPAGSVMTVELELEGSSFVLLNGGPIFKFTPAISFLVACETAGEADRLWAKLGEGAFVMMEYDKYPFADKYGWLADRFGLSWQVMYQADREPSQRITPTLMFVGEACGRAEEAMKHYASLFQRSKVGEIHRYGKDESPDKEGTAKHARFTLDGQEFAAMDSAHAHRFSFNEAVSFQIFCRNQEEIEHYWKGLSSVPQAEQCGWVKDRFGVSWQIVPEVLGKLMKDPDPVKSGRVMSAMLQMKKLDIAALEQAHSG